MVTVLRGDQYNHNLLKVLLNFKNQVYAIFGILILLLKRTIYIMNFQKFIRYSISINFNGILPITHQSNQQFDLLYVGMEK